MSPRNARSYFRLSDKAPRPAPAAPVLPQGGPAPTPVAVGSASGLRALVAAPEHDVVAEATFHLANLGLRVETAFTGSEVIAALADHRPDLIVLSVTLPGVAGLEVLRRLRVMPDTRDIAVLALLGAHAGPDDPSGVEALRLEALATGADDCLAAPLDPRELVLRATSILRRVTRVLPDVNEVLSVDEITLNVGSQEVTVDGALVELTPREFLLLRLLITHPGRLFTRAQLMNLLWEGQKPGSARSIDMHVYRLREKLGAAAACIDTVRTEGYRLRRRRAKRGTG